MLWFIIPALLTVHVLVCLLLVIVVLMQLPRSEGLGAAFGGSVTENIFGAQTTHVLARFTVWLGIAFFVITLALAIAYTHRDSGKTGIQRQLLSAPAVPAASPVASATPVADVPAAPVAAPEASPEPVASEAAAAATPTAAPETAPVTPEAAATPAAPAPAPAN